MKRPVFVANWKMNLGPTEARAFIRKFTARYKRRANRTVVIVPSAAALTTVATALARRKDIIIGVQNIHAESKGAFTGETSAVMARDAGARLALVGHSERRHVFGETDDATALKCARALEHSLTPVLCVGETLKQREAGEAESTVLRQLRTGVSRLTTTQLPGIMIAYEPVWAIGTGRNATPADAAAMHGAIRAELAQLMGSAKAAAAIAILYGGSVNADNARGLLAASDVDGLLVGGASLDPVAWSAIVST